MLIFDLDSLVGVNDNESVSSMGISKSYAMNNQKFFSIAVEAAKKAVFAPASGQVRHFVLTGFWSLSPKRCDQLSLCRSSGQ